MPEDNSEAASPTAPPRDPPVRGHLAYAAELLLKVVAIGVPVLYAFGRLYAISYWESLGLTPSVMAYSIEDYLFLGFSAGISAVARLLGVAAVTTLGYALLVATIVVIVIVLFAAIDRWLTQVLRRRAIKLQRRIETWRKSKHGAMVDHGVFAVATGTGLVFLVYIALVGFSIAFLPLVFAIKEGQRAALQARHNLDGTTRPTYARPQAVAHYVIDGEAVAAPLLDCSEHWCVIFHNAQFVAVPRSDVQRIDQATPLPIEPK